MTANAERWTCDNCGREGVPSDARMASQPTTWSEPGYDFEACRRCCPDARDLEHARDRWVDRQLDEADL